MKLLLRGILLGSLMFLITACAPQEKYDVDSLKRDISELTVQKTELQRDIEILKQDSGIERYYVTVEIKQSHFSLDISDHLKDKMNAVELTFPVDKAFFENVEVGTVLDNSFRAGSYLMSGSIGNWNIKVISKEVSE